MNEDIQKAIREATDSSDETTMLAACEYLVANRDQLTQRVFINLPGGLSGNNDVRWNEVKANTKERCGCGNERTIMPANPRAEYVASSDPAVVVSAGTPLHFRPKGGDKASTLMRLKVSPTDTQGYVLELMKDPFAPFVLSMDLFGGKGYLLKPLAEALEKQPGVPAILFSGDNTPILGITTVDPVAGTVTCVCDVDIVAFKKEDDAPTGHQHG